MSEFNIIYVQVLIGVIVVSLTIYVGVIYFSPSKKQPTKSSSGKKDKIKTKTDDEILNNNIDYKNLLNTSHDGDVLHGRTDKYSWNQNEAEVEMYIDLHVYSAAGSREVGAKDIKVTIKSTSLVVHINGKEVINGEFYAKVIADDCSWLIDTLRNGRKQLWFTFMKATPTVRNKHWKSLLKGDAEVNVSSLGPPVLGVDSSDVNSMKDAIKKVCLFILSLLFNVNITHGLYLIYP